MITGLVLTLLVAGQGSGAAAPPAEAARSAPSPSGSRVAGPPGSTTGTPSPVPSAAVSAPAVPAGMALSVPALGLTTVVEDVVPVDGTIDPPTFDRAYRIAPYGTPGSDNTTYIAGHSWNAGDAVFNPLLDAGTQQATLAPGDAVEVVEDGRTYRYEVVGTARYPKGALADVDEVWEKVPGRLVLITCVQRGAGVRSLDNLVVTAQLVDQVPPTARTAPADA